MSVVPGLLGKPALLEAEAVLSCSRADEAVQPVAQLRGFDCAPVLHGPNTRGNVGSKFLLSLR